MTELHVHISDDVAERLTAAAAERGSTTEDVAADLLTQHAPTATPTPSNTEHRFAFIGAGGSGRSDLSERVEELLAEDFGG